MFAESIDVGTDDHRRKLHTQSGLKNDVTGNRFQVTFLREDVV